MKIRFLIIYFFIFLFFLKSSLFCIDKIRWKAQTIYTTEEVEAPFKRVVEKLKIISDKKINIRYYTSNSIVPNNEIWAGVKSGNLDVAFSSPSANSLKQPSLFIFSGIPFGPELTEFRVWMAYGGGQIIKDRIYKNNGLHAIDCMVIPPETGGWFKKKINNTKDLKNINMRIFGYGSKIMQHFGVTPKSISGMDIANEFKKGHIDAAEFSLPKWDLFVGINQYAKYSYFPGWIQPSTFSEMVINKNKWDSISESTQTLIETVCESNLIWSNTYYNSIQPEAMEELKKQGTIFMKWKDSDLRQFKQVWIKIAEEESRKDPLFAEVYQSYKKFRKKYAIWGSRAYLR